jgi:tetrapyrrole methylase family protein/MazG family protein
MTKITASILEFPENVVVVEGKKLLSLRHMLTPPHLETIIRNPKDPERIWSILSEEYPQDHPMELIHRLSSGELISADIQLKDLNISDSKIEEAAAIRIPPLAENRSLEYFQNIVAILRAPDGCPWDRKQTHQTLRDDLLQEVYELLDGLDRNDLDAISEELGDVLLHVVIQAQIALENCEFNMGDVASHISEKLIFRHRHVFEKTEELSAEQVLDRWEKIKKIEREKNDKKQGLLDGISNSMPALSMAFSYQKRASKVGFDWDSITGVWDKLFEEIEEFRKAETSEEKADEMGDIFFSLVNLARWKKIDPETSLRMANLKFYNRVRYVEEKAKTLGRDLFEMPLEEKDRYWDEYKAAK